MAKHLTQEGIDRLHALEDKFKQNVARALEQWRVANGFDQKTEFADALGVSRQVYGKVSLAGMITSTENYARMFLVTGLPEVDPRKIPDRLGTASGNHFAVRQAWDDEEWNTWRLAQESAGQAPKSVSQQAQPTARTTTGAPRQGAQQAQRTDTSMQPHAPQLSPIQQIVEVFMEDLATRTAAKIAAGQHTSEMTEAELIAAFRSFVNKYIAGSPQMRDELYRTFGRDLAQIGALLDGLTNPSRDVREFTARFN